MATSPPTADVPHEGIRRRSAPSTSKPATSDVVGDVLPPSPALVAAAANPTRPTLSRTSTDSNNSSATGGSSRFEIGEEDPFSAFSLLDFINVVDAHWDLWTRPLRRKSDAWRSRADKLLDDAKQRGRESFQKLPTALTSSNNNDFHSSSTSSSSTSSRPGHQPGTTTPGGRGGELAGLSHKERERLERKYREVRERMRTSVSKLVVKWEEE